MYVGKRRGSYRRRYRRASKLNMRFVTAKATNVSRKVKKAYAKAASLRAYDTAVFKSHGLIKSDQDLFPGDESVIYLSNMLGLSSPSVGTEGVLTPFALAQANPNKLDRYVNMYKQFRVKYITFQWIPRSSVHPIVNTNNNYVIPTGGGQSYIPPPTDHLWQVKWLYPSDTGLVANASGFDQFGGSYFGASNLSVPSAEIMASDTNTKRYPMQKNLVLSWKPKVFGYKINNFVPLNTLTVAGVPTNSGTTTSMKFPWTNCIDPQVVGTQGGQIYNTTGFRQPLTQPLFSTWDISADAPTPNTNVDGRWEITAVFEFRYKRGDAATVAGLATNQPLAATTLVG